MDLHGLATALVTPLRAWFMPRLSVDDDTIGTWTPVYYGLTTAGSTTYVQQSGMWYRVGPIVFVQGRVQWSACSGTGDAVISLPFAPIAQFPISVCTDGVTIGTFTPFGMVQAGAAAFRLFRPANNGGSAAIAVEAAGEVTFMTTYFLA